MTTKTKSIIIVAVVILALAIAAFIFLAPPAAAPGPENGVSGEAGGNMPGYGTGAPADPTTPPTSETEPPAPAPAPTGITMAQVATHSTASDCWTVIRGEIYNLTSWISQHPGGQAAILQLCGRDGTAEFTGQHGGSSQQENKLATFKIGVLAQ